MYLLVCPKNVCAPSQYIVYWIHFQNIRTFTYQKHYFKHFFACFSNHGKAFSVSLKTIDFLLFVESIIQLFIWHELNYFVVELESSQIKIKYT